MSKNKCGLTPKQREKALRECGLEQIRSTGSHATWVHPALKLLANTHKFEIPANLKSGNEQSPWTVTVPDDPANGTWGTIIKYAKWCQETVQQTTAGSEHDRQRCNVAGQFRTAAARPPAKAGKRRHQNTRNSGIPSPSPM